MEELNSEGVFVKLSSRSPKDALNRLPVKHELLKQLLDEKSRSLQSSTLSHNDIVGCIYQAHISSFKLTTAHDVLETLLSSDRVMTDEIPLVLEHKAVNWKEHIVLREWVDVPIEYEFRGFVYDNKLTALCQYYDEVCYLSLVRNRDMIEEAIISFFERVKDRIPLSPKEYVLDFLVEVVEGKGEASPSCRVRIVEINPFGKPDGLGTGTVMFDVKNESDRATIFGESPFQFRIETAPLSREQYHALVGGSGIIEEIVKKYEPTE